MPRQIIFDPDALDEIDALYIIHMANKVLGSDHVTTALTQAAWDLAGDMVIANDGTDSLQHSAADAIYPQIGGSMTWHQADAKAAEHLRRFGFLKDVAE